MAATTREERRIRGAALGGGVLAGVLGGLAMLAWLAVFSGFTGRGYSYPLKMVAALVLGGRALQEGAAAGFLGLAVHLAFSAVLGGAFAEAMRHRKLDPIVEVLGAIVFGIAVWLVATFLVAPWADPVLRADPGYAIAWFGSHVAYGAVLGWAQGLRDQALASRPPPSARATLAWAAGDAASVGATVMLNVLVGIGLTMSALMWRRAIGERIEVLLVAAAVVAVAILARRTPPLRWVDVPIGLWLVASAWLVHHARSWSTWSAVSFGLVLVLVPLAELAFQDGAAPRRAEV